VARDIARSGAAYYDEGAWEQARDHFHRAYQLIAAPTLALMEARALVNLGRLVQAFAVYDLAVTRLADPANEAYRKASQVALEERELLRRRIPTVRVQLPIGTSGSVRIDGVVIDAASLRSKLALDPGTHALELQSGGVKGWVSVTLSEGDDRVLQLPFASDDQVAALAARQRVAMWSALIVGTAGAALGVTAGAIASGQATAADGPAEHGWSAASTLGYVLGTAGVATGIWLFATLPRAKTSPRVAAVVSAHGPELLVAGAF
jgi:tetratricopeptide (TPR) repeat protein